MSTLDNLRKAAKRWLKALRAGDAEAFARLRRAHPGAGANPGLRDVQHALAREHGHESWKALKDQAGQRALGASRHEGLANDLVAAFETGEPTALARLSEHYGRTLTAEVVRSEVWRGLESYRRSRRFTLDDA